jgi:hypothetical protein
MKSKIYCFLLAVVFCPLILAAPDTNISKIYGNWKSVNKSDVSGEYLTTKITQDQWQESSGEMVPYKVVDIQGSKITIEWSQEGFSGSITRKSIINILENGDIELQWSSLNNPIKFKKVD